MKSFYKYFSEPTYARAQTERAAWDTPPGTEGYRGISRNQRAKPCRLWIGPGYLIPLGALEFAGKKYPVYTGGGVLKD